MNQNTCRTWAEIDLEALEHNYLTLRNQLPRGCKFVGVVKANAYGHGVLPVALRLEQLGADYLAVATLDEAIELRRGGVEMPVLILGCTVPERAEELFRWRATQTVTSPEMAKLLSETAVKLGQNITVHLKADTGMTRLGLLCDEAHLDASVETAAAMHGLPGLNWEGVFTHFANADEDEDYTMLQFTRFLEFLDKLEAKGITFPLRHCAASAATLLYPCTHLDMVRPGIALYGHYPCPDCEGLDGPGLMPVMTLKTRVAAVRELPAGTKVSYGCTFTLNRASRLAVLPIGYADGLPRSCSGKLEVMFNGQRARQLGRVCMDMCMVDVTDLPEVKPGDEAELFGALLAAEEVAEKAGTVQYELLTGISPRVPRVIVN